MGNLKTLRGLLVCIAFLERTSTNISVTRERTTGTTRILSATGGAATCLDKAECSKFRKPLDCTRDPWFRQNCQASCNTCPRGTSKTTRTSTREVSSQPRRTTALKRVASVTASSHPQRTVVTTWIPSPAAESRACRDDNACTRFYDFHRLCSGTNEWYRQHCRLSCNMCTTDQVSVTREISQTITTSPVRSRNVSVQVHDDVTWSHPQRTVVTTWIPSPAASSGACKDDNACTNYKDFHHLCSGTDGWYRKHCRLSCNMCNSDQVSVTREISQTITTIPVKARNVSVQVHDDVSQVTTAAVTTEVAGQCRAVFKCAREFQGKIRSPDTTRVDVCRAVDDYVTCYLNNCHGEETLPDAQKNFLQREMGKKGFDCEIPSSLKTSTTVVTTSTALITTAILATTSPPQSDLSSTDAPSLTEVGGSVETQSTQGISLATDDTTLESLDTWTTDDVGSADTLSTQRDADEYETTSIDRVTSAEAYDGESEITFSIEDEKEVSSLDTWTSDTWTSGTASVTETVSTTGAVEKDEDIKKPSEQEDTKLTTAEFNKALGTLDAVLADNTTFSNTSTTEKVVTVISELMRADVTQFKESSTDSVSAATRVLQVVDNLLEKVELTDGQFMSTAPNLIVAAREVNASMFTGLALITNADDKVLETPEFQSTPTVAENVNRVSSLALPASLLSSVSNATEVRISMTVHRTAVLFEAIRRNVSRPANSSDYVREINSHVLSASVVGFHITNMTDPVTIVLAHHKQNSVGPECVFWDSNINDWSTEGCWMKKENITDSRTICECNHLTNFALLMDVYSTGSSVGETDRKILSIVSYIGCGASLLALLLTLITYGVFGGFRNVRRPSLQERNQRDNPSKILLNLCVALALTNLVFMAGMHDHAFKSLPACKFVAAFLHFSLLAALGWMAVEAVYMYLALVLVFKTNYNNFLLKCSLAGWGAPLVITVITLGVNKTDNYGMLDSGVCWLKGNAFYIAFLAPICAILLMNFIVFGLVMRRIMGLSERKLNKSDTYTAKKQLRGAVGVVILLGLTWVFAIFAIDRASIVFNYLFAIFNSLQGLFIFLYNCLLKKEIRTAWMNKFRWIRMREETTDLTTSKANYLRVTNIGTSTGKSEQYPDDSTACSAVADTSVNEAHSTMIEMTSSTQDSDKATPTQSANTPNDVLDINPLTSTAKEPSLTTVDESTSAATDTDVCTSESETKVLATCGPGPDISTPQSRTNTDTPVNGQTNMMSCTFQLTTNIITTAAPVGDVNVAPPILTVPTVSMDTLADTTIPVIVDTPLYISTLNVPPLQVSSSDI